MLHRLIAITFTRATNAQAFHGHREEIDEVYSGNCLSRVELLTEFDPVLHKPSEKIHYLSPQIQIEFIEPLANNFKAELLQNIKSAPFLVLVKPGQKLLGQNLEAKYCL